MSWTYKIDERALKELRKLSRQTQSEILDYLDQRIAGDEDPRRFGKPLRGDPKIRWIRLLGYRHGADRRTP